jgi:hypothetical protein
VTSLEIKGATETDIPGLVEIRKVVDDLGRARKKSQISLARGHPGSKKCHTSSP